VTPTLEALWHEPLDFDVDELGTPFDDAWADDAPSPRPLETVQQLIDDARFEQASRPRLSLGRAYFVGVQAAAEQALHPDRVALRNVSWLDRFNPGFVSGYVETTALLAPLWSWPSDS